MTTLSIGALVSETVNSRQTLLDERQDFSTIAISTASRAYSHARVLVTTSSELVRRHRIKAFAISAAVLLSLLLFILADRSNGSGTGLDKYGNEWVESKIEVNGITVSYYSNLQNNTEVPYLVYYHGGGTDGTDGIGIFGPVAAKYQVILPSARGFGKTSRLPPYGTAQMVLDAEAFLPAALNLSSGRSLFLAGHSMGATIAPRVAKENSSIVSKLILEDPGWLRRQGEDPSKNRPGYTPRGGDSLSNESVEDITVPTLILTAEHGDGVPEVIDAAVESYPNGYKFYFPDAGHCIHCDYLDQYLRVVDGFFQT